MLRAGATCVDLYSAFIYQGWSVARRINTELAALLRHQHAAAHAPDAVAGARPAGASASPRKVAGPGSSIL
jgi:dihydroorotate dehydrogenase